MKSKGKGPQATAGHSFFSTKSQNSRACIGVKAEDARYVLPNACETVIYVTFDFRNLFHFFNERLCSRAQKEIRDIAVQMKDQIIEKCSVIKPYCVPKCEAHQIPYCTESPKDCCGRHKRLIEIVRDEYK